MPRVIKDQESFDQFLRDWYFKLGKYRIFDQADIIVWADQLIGRYMLHVGFRNGHSTRRSIKRFFLRRRPRLRGHLLEPDISSLSGVAVQAMTLWDANELGMHLTDELSDDEQRYLLEQEGSPKTGLRQL